MRPLVLAVVLALSSLASANCVKVGTLTYVGHGTFQCQSRERLFVKHRFARLRYSTAAVAAAKSATSINHPAVRSLNAPGNRRRLVASVCGLALHSLTARNNQVAHSIHKVIVRLNDLAIGVALIQTKLLQPISERSEYF